MKPATATKLLLIAAQSAKGAALFSSFLPCREEASCTRRGLFRSDHKDDTTAPTAPPTNSPTVPPTAAPTSAPTPIPDPLIIFVTSETFDGNLTGLAGADGHCQRLADAAGLGGTFQAWLSTSSASVNDRFITKSTGPYVLTNGTVVANNWEDLTGCDNTVDFWVDENQQNVEDNLLTGTWCDGAFITQDDTNECEDYTSAAGDMGALGIVKPGVVQNTFRRNAKFWCRMQLHLLCFQQTTMN